MDEIFLTGMQVECIVGLYPTERRIPQPLKVDLRLVLDTRAAGSNGRIAETVDYAEIAGEVRFLLEASRFFLIETACEALARYILAPPLPGVGRAQVEAVSIEMTKVSRNVHGGVPGVSIQRRRGEMEYGLEQRSFGLVDVLFEPRECGIYRLRLKPGSCIPTHLHRVMDESELILTEGVLLQGEPAERGEARRWPVGFPHRYDNKTTNEQAILCVDSPSFLPEDQIAVDDSPGALAEVPAFDFYDAMRFES